MMRPVSGIEAELENGVGARAGGDVGHVAVAVGGVGLEAVGAGARGHPLHRRPGHRAVVTDGVDRRVAGVVVGRQQVTSRPVGGDEAGVRLQAGHSDQAYFARVPVQPVAGDLQGIPAAHVNKVPVRAGRHGRGTARGLYLSQLLQLPAGRVHGEPQHLVLTGYGYIHVESHSPTSSMCRLNPEWP